MTETKLESEIQITEKAANEIKKIMAENNVPGEYGLRVGVKGSSSSGLIYSLGFDSKANEGDSTFDMKGIKLFVDGKSLFYLSGTTLDFTDGLNGKGFVFDNPNAVKSC